MLLGCVGSACCAPMNHGSTTGEVKEELRSFKADLAHSLASLFPGSW